MIDKRKRSLLALLLVVAMALSLSPTVFAGGDDGTDAPALTGLSLTVNAGDLTAMPDLENANVVVDLYKIAGAALDTEHGNTYVFTSPAVNFGSSVDITSYDGLSALTADDWASMAETAAYAVLGGSSVTLTPAATGVSAGETIEGLAGGLYLVVARSSDLTALSDYRKVDGNKVTTLANSVEYNYTYAPSLVALPGNENGTDTAGAWLTDNEVTLKPEQSDRMGYLLLTKELENFETTSDYATFVFLVEATMGAANTVVYRNYVSLTFEGPGELSYEPMIRIPVGASVTATEVYTGACYKLTSNRTASGTIPAPYAEDDEERTDLQYLELTFSNNYDGTLITGYGIENSYYYSDGWNYGKEATVK